MKKENLILNKTFDFALDSITIYKQLIAKKEYIISKQFLKSATSIGANVNESVSAESRKDFIHKLSIALKEARETEYWLRLLNQSKIVDVNFNNIIDQNDEIIKILTAITKTTKLNS